MLPTLVMLVHAAPGRLHVHGCLNHGSGPQTGPKRFEKCGGGGNLLQDFIRDATQSEEDTCIDVVIGWLWPMEC